MNKNQVKGIIDDVAGTVKRKAGELSDNPKLQLKGVVQQAKGKAEGTWGKAAEAVHHAIKNTAMHLDTHVTLKAKNPTAAAEYKK